MVQYTDFEVLIDGQPVQVAPGPSPITITRRLVAPGGVMTWQASVALIAGQAVRENMPIQISIGANRTPRFAGTVTDPDATDPLPEATVTASSMTRALRLPRPSGPLTFGTPGDGGHPAGWLVAQILALAGIDASNIDQTLATWNWNVGTVDVAQFTEANYAACLDMLLKVGRFFIYDEGDGTIVLRQVSRLAQMLPARTFDAKTNIIKSSTRKVGESCNHQVVRGDTIPNPTPSVTQPTLLIEQEAASTLPVVTPPGVVDAALLSSYLIQSVADAKRFATEHLAEREQALYEWSGTVPGDATIQIGESVAINDPRLGYYGVRGVIVGITDRIGEFYETDVVVATNKNKDFSTAGALPIARDDYIPTIIGDPKDLVLANGVRSTAASSDAPLDRWERTVTDPYTGAGGLTGVYTDTQPVHRFRFEMNSPATARTVIISLRVHDTKGRWSLPYKTAIYLTTAGLGNQTFAWHMGIAAGSIIGTTADGGQTWRDIGVDTATLGNAVSIAGTHDDPSRDAYIAGTAGGYVIRTTDGRTVAPGFPVLVEGGSSIDAVWADNSAIPVYYAGTSSGRVWKSVDKGLHWTKILDLAALYGGTPRVTRIVTDAYATGTIYAFGGDSDQRPSLINRSLDGGATWGSLSASPAWGGYAIPSGTYVVDAGSQSGTTVVALSSGGVIAQQDGGGGEVLAPPVLSAPPVSVTYGLSASAGIPGAPPTTGTVSILTADGHVWQATSLTTMALTDRDSPTAHSHGAVVNQIRADEHLSGVLYTAEGPQLLRVNDNDGDPAAWKDLRGPFGAYPLPVGTVVHQIAFSSYARLVTPTIPGNWLICMRDLDSTGGSTHYLFRFRSGVYTQAVMPGGATNGLTGIYIAPGGKRMFGIDASAMGGDWYRPPYGGVLSYSDDLAATWHPVTGSLTGLVVNDCLPLPDGQTVYATAQTPGEPSTAVQASIHRSTDNGQTWAQIYAGPAAGTAQPHLARIKAKASNQSWLMALGGKNGSAGGGSVGVYSIDGGATWQPAPVYGYFGTQWRGDFALLTSGSIILTSNRDASFSQVYRADWTGGGYTDFAPINGGFAAGEQTLIDIPDYNLSTSISGDTAEHVLMDPAGGSTSLTYDPRMTHPTSVAIDWTNRVIYRANWSVTGTGSPVVYSGPVWKRGFGDAAWVSAGDAAGFWALLVSLGIQTHNLLSQRQRWLIVTG